MSKSLGTIVDPLDAARRGSAPIRCGCTSSKEIAFGGDGDFTWERFDERYNVDLANNLGNLVSRVAAMAERYRDGRLRAGGRAVRPARAVAASRPSPTTARRWTRYALHEGAAAAFRLIDATNEYIAATAPWALAKDPASGRRLTQVLFDAAEAVRLAAVLLLAGHAGVGRRDPAARRRRPPTVELVGSTATAAGAPTGERDARTAGRCGRAWTTRELRP